mgnify:CR=1 FL=1
MRAAQAATLGMVDGQGRPTPEYNQKEREALRVLYGVTPVAPEDRAKAQRIAADIRMGRGTAQQVYDDPNIPAGVKLALADLLGVAPKKP